jgi:protein TonB
MNSLSLSNSMSTLAPARPASLPRMGRNTTIVVSVVALHVAVLWAMQSGLLRRVADIVVPAEILVEIMAPAAPPTPQAAPQPKAVNKPVPKQAAVQPTPAPAPVPQAAPTPLAIAPSATAPAATAAAPTATSTSTASTSGQAPQASPAPPAPARVELPSSDADYLNNPKPAYPRESQRRREQGRVVVQVYIGTDGQASRATLSKSSGYEALDKLALETALKWRYVPGKRNGVPEGMEFEVPFNFQLPR